mmetsp:Transcript_29134/g.67740  ORF Transcript_29134/g.67740 Transcript_29134/m.67740 type:complete len:205 (-) Transcript_29134:27-641(-)
MGSFLQSRARPAALLRLPLLGASKPADASAFVRGTVWAWRCNAGLLGDKSSSVGSSSSRTLLRFERSIVKDFLWLVEPDRCCNLSVSSMLPCGSLCEEEELEHPLASDGGLVDCQLLCRASDAALMSFASQAWVEVSASLLRTFKCAHLPKARRSPSVKRCPCANVLPWETSLAVPKAGSACDVIGSELELCERKLLRLSCRVT